MRYNKVFDALNKKQRLAVEMPRVPVLLLAGPGTGKTRTLICRIVYQIHNFEIAPEHILALTFTNKAAMEMQNRLQDILKEKAEKVKISTIHSFCLDILRKNYKEAGLDQYFSVCSDAYQTNLIHMLIFDKIRSDRDKAVKGIKMSVDHFIMRNKPMPAFTAMIYELYVKHLEKHRLLDFNQILVKTRDLFRQNRDMLEQYSFLYQAIHVDEFQDTDTVQYDIIKMLTQKHRNIFVVADDDQSIYAWRGANPENIKNFIEDFNISAPVFLDINYRSGTKIINTAQNIVKSIERIEPGKTQKASDMINDSIVARFFDVEQQEISFIIEKIRYWYSKKVPFHEMAVLYPQHRFAEKLSLQLIAERIPFQQASGRNFQDDPQMKKLLLYLQVIRDPLDPLILEELVENELGYHVHKQIQNLQNVIKGSYRKALYEFGNRSEVSESLRNEMSTFIGHLANLVNLKSFYNFEQLVKQILYGLQNMDKSYIEEKAEKFSEFALAFPGDLFRKKIWLYHTDEKQAFIARHMLQRIFINEVKYLTASSREEIEKNDFLILMEKPSFEYNGISINIMDQSTDKRESAFSSLLRFCQIGLVEQDTVFNSYVVFDLETTGRDIETCGIVEIAAVKVKNGEISDTLQTLINPQMEIEKEAMSVHHITKEQVSQAPTIEQIWPKFKKFLGKEIIIAHNGYAFDFKIMDRFAMQIDGQKIPNVRYDSLIFARQMYPNEHNSIDALSERFNFDPGERHRALDDVKVLHLIFQRILHEFLENQKKINADFLFEYCALANYLDDKLSRFEDRVFFLAGVQKLLSPYSAILARYCETFGSDIESLINEISEKVRQLYPSIQPYDSDDDFKTKVLLLVEEFKNLAIDKAIAEFLSVIMLINPQDKLSQADAVSLLTFHSAKGLEFQKVIIIGMEDENMPNFFAYRTDDYDDRSVRKKIDEQKRLLYVGLTRARDEVILTAVKNRFGRQQKSSPFLREIYKYMKENV